MGKVVGHTHCEQVGLAGQRSLVLMLMLMLVLVLICDV
jgi:hypothetical protein